MCRRFVFRIEVSSRTGFYVFGSSLNIRYDRSVRFARYRVVVRRLVGLAGFRRRMGLITEMFTGRFLYIRFGVLSLVLRWIKI